MKPCPEPWDGFEPVTDAIDRFALRELFDLAIGNGLRVEAVALLMYVGVGEARATLIIDGVLPDARD
jgi:hypothetical protein